MYRRDTRSRLLLQCLLVASLLLAVVQVVKNVKKQSEIDDDDDFDVPLITLNEPSVSPSSDSLVTIPPLQSALSSLQLMRDALAHMQSKVQHMEQFYRSAVLPGVEIMQQKLEEIDQVPRYEIQRVSKITKICADQVEESCAVVQDDLKSLLVDVQFIISDLKNDVANVVPSSFGTMRTFMKEFDISFDKNKIALQRAAQNVNVAILRAMENVNDPRADDIKATLLVLTGDLKSDLDDVTKSKVKYDEVKGDAARDLNKFIISS